MSRWAGVSASNYRMVVIFGFGPGSPEDLGEVAPCVCPNCHNQVFLHHVRSKKSVRLYFVPVVPYGTDDYLVCPVCSRGLQISDAQLRHVRPMSSATASFRAGRLPQARYTTQVERFWRQLGVNPAGQQLVTPASPGASAPAQPGIPVRSPTSAQPPPVATDDQTSWLSQLHKLAQLHDQGVLSDAVLCGRQATHPGTEEAALAAGADSLQRLAKPPEVAGTTLGRVTISRNRSDKILHKRPDCHEDSASMVPRSAAEVIRSVRVIRRQSLWLSRLGVVLDSGLSADEAAEWLRLTGIWH